MSSQRPWPPSGNEPVGDSEPPSGSSASGEPNEPKEPAPRSAAGLRVAVYFLTVFMVISFSASLALSLIEGPEAVKALAAKPDTEFEPVLFLWLRLSTLPLVFLVTALFVRRVDRHALRAIGLALPRGSGSHALLAVLATAPLALWYLISTPFVSSEIVAWTREALILDPWLPLGFSGLLRLTIAFLGIAFLDELIFRGYVYSAFRERFGWVNAAGLTNLLSVALQAGDPKIGAAGLINTFLIGIALAAMRERTGSLLMPTVFLGVWNVVLGCVLSLPVSGTLFPSLFDHHIEGPLALTGGDFGPEGSWLLTGLLLALVAALALWVDRGKNRVSEL